MDNTKLQAVYVHLLYSTTITFVLSVAVGWLELSMPLLVALPAMAYIWNDLIGILNYEKPHGDYEMTSMFLLRFIPLFTGGGYAMLLIPFSVPPKPYMAFGMMSFAVLLLDTLRLVGINILCELEERKRKEREEAAKKDK